MTATGKGKPRGRPFQKGASGNPKGRPKESADLKALAREHTEEAVERLVHWLRSDNAKASVAAAQAILDRGYGKPVQAVTGEDGEGPIKHAVEIRIVDPGG